MNLSLYKAILSILSVMLAVYFLACFHVCMLSEPPVWSRFGVWMMFTKKSVLHSSLEAEALLSTGEVKKLDLERLYPAVWDSGHIYQRSTFNQNQFYMSKFAKNICKRDPTIETLMFYDLICPIVVGQESKLCNNNKKKLNTKWNCREFRY
jgi:hypothetical protein